MLWLRLEQLLETFGLFFIQPSGHTALPPHSHTDQAVSFLSLLLASMAFAGREKDVGQD